MKRLLSLLVLFSACEDRLQEPPLLNAPGAITVLEESTTPTGDTGWWPSVRFDAHDTPHIAYCDAALGNVRYATRKEGVWQLETVAEEGSVGKYLTLGIDQNNQPAIAYYDQGRQKITVAFRTQKNTWRFEDVAIGREIGIGSVLYFLPNNDAYLFYYTAKGRLMLALRKEASEDSHWQVSTLHEAYGGYSAEISAAYHEGYLFITFIHWGFKSTELLWAKGQDKDWQITSLPLEPGAGWRSTLAFASGQKRLVYTVGSKKELRWAVEKNGRWHQQRLLVNVGNMAATATSSGNFVIAYEDVAPRQKVLSTLKLLKQVGNTWQRYAIDSDGPVGDHMSIALNAAGKPLVVYRAYPIKGLRLYDETELP